MTGTILRLTFRLTILLAGISFYILPANSFAQEELVPPPAKKITSFPFTQLTGGVIIIKAQLDAFPDTLNFVLDTGGGGISLDSATCAYFGLKKEPSDRLIRGIAGMKYAEFAKAHSIVFPGLRIDNLDFHINDYEILTSAYGIRIDGIIGYSFFRRYIVMINYDKETVDVMEPGTIKYPKGGYLLNPQFTTLPMQYATVKDNTEVNAKFYFDTGAGLSLMLNDEIVADSAIISKKRKQYLTEVEGLGGKRPTMITVVKEVRLGPYKFKNVPTHVFNDEFNITPYPILGGLIGNDLLRRFNVILNYPEQQIYIKPNTHFNDAFDYSYTGLGIYLIDGAITVTDIIKGSPAEESGLKEGDVIIGVENNFTNNIQTYKTLLQNAKTRIQVVVIRNNKLEVFYVKVKSIL